MVRIKVCGAERISRPPYAEAIPIAAALVRAGGERVLWGTDFPHPNATHEAITYFFDDLVQPVLAWFNRTDR